jgi:hypothetical protein
MLSAFGWLHADPKTGTALALDAQFNGEFYRCLEAWLEVISPLRSLFR